MNEPHRPKRYGCNYFPNTFGFHFSLSWDGTFFEDYGFKRKIKYIDIRVGILCWSLFWQIPIKKYGIRGIIPATKG